jgi:hypothetical protein
MQFLESATFVILAVGAATALVWLTSKRTLPLQTSYQRAILYLARFVGLAGMAIYGLCLLLALSDLAEITHFGYSVYSIPVGAIFIIVGYCIQSFAARWLRSAQISN